MPINLIWKSIPGYEPYYEVSNQGDVRRVNSDKYIVLKSWNALGYRAVRLSINNKAKDEFIHRLVARAFISNPDNKPQVNHIDGDKSNNNVNNLEWVTQSENALHAYRNGLISVDVEKKRAAAKLGTERVKVKVRCNETGAEFDSISAASRHFNISIDRIAYASLHNKSVEGWTFSRIGGQ